MFTYRRDGCSVHECVIENINMSSTIRIIFGKTVLQLTFKIRKNTSQYRQKVFNKLTHVCFNFVAALLPKYTFLVKVCYCEEYVNIIFGFLFIAAVGQIIVA